MKTLCIYHGNCQDGFAAAWTARQIRAFGDRVEFYPGVYQDAPPNVTSRDVVFVDFSYKRSVLEEMAANARSIVIFDHHKSAEEDLAPFRVELCSSRAFIGLTRRQVCGATLAELGDGRLNHCLHFDMGAIGRWNGMGLLQLRRATATSDQPH